MQYCTSFEAHKRTEILPPEVLPWGRRKASHDLVHCLYSMDEVCTYEGNNCRRAGQDSTPAAENPSDGITREQILHVAAAHVSLPLLPESGVGRSRDIGSSRCIRPSHPSRPDRRASPGDLGSRIRLARRRVRRPIDPRIMGREDPRRRSSGTKAWRASAFRASLRRGTQRGIQRGADACAPSGGSVPWLGQGPQRRRREGEIVGLAAGYRLPELIRAACGGNDRE
jgi:hypothetical protein